MPDFAFYDPDSPVDITCRNLPHWTQAGATYFVTFRTEDSLPASAIEDLNCKRREWLAVYGVSLDVPNWRNALERLPKPIQIEYHRNFNREFHSLLDNGFGACVLRRPECARIVADAIRHFDGERYHLSGFVVMPNHVHVLMGLIGEHMLSDVCRSWKKFTALHINQFLGTRGHFWQGESFDHLVRSEEQFEYFHGYIVSNPAKAGLEPGEYLLFQAT